VPGDKKGVIDRVHEEEGPWGGGKRLCPPKKEGKKKNVLREKRRGMGCAGRGRHVEKERLNRSRKRNSKKKKEKGEKIGQ